MKNPIVGRLVRATKEFILLILTASSITINVIFYGGSRYQTVSSRAYVESKKSKEWDKRLKRINRFFFWQDNHCKQSWEAEVFRAKRTLQRQGEIGDLQTITTK